MKFVGVHVQLLPALPRVISMKYDKIRSHHVMAVSRSSGFANCVTRSLMDNPGRHDTNHVTSLISKAGWPSALMQKGCVRSLHRSLARSLVRFRSRPSVAVNPKECDNALKRDTRASRGSFPKGYELPVPRQFQPIYYSRCFDVRPAAGCCDTGSQSKTLVWNN